MSNGKKFLRQASIRFQREDPLRYKVCGFLCKRAAELIRKKGVPEVTVGFYKGMYYEKA